MHRTERLNFPPEAQPLTNYQAAQPYLNWIIPLILACGVFLGAYFGGLNTTAQIASPAATLIVTAVIAQVLRYKNDPSAALPIEPAAPPVGAQSGPPEHAPAPRAPAPASAPAPQVRRVEAKKAPTAPLPARIGIRNPDNRQCTYISWALVIAHACPEGFIETALRNKEDPWKQQIESLTTDLETLRKSLIDLDVEFIKLNAAKFVAKAAFDEERAKYTPRQLPILDSSRELCYSEICEIGSIDTYYAYQAKKDSYPRASNDVADCLRRKERAVDEMTRKREHLDGCTQQAIDHRNEEARKIERSIVLLKILRTGVGNPTHEAAHELHELTAYESFAPKEIIVHDLRETLYNGNWKIIRAGGHGHWWTYVRNPGKNTVDEINDNRVIRDRMTFDQIIAWRNRESIAVSQIHFF